MSVPSLFHPDPLPQVGFAGSLSFTFYWAAQLSMPPGWTLQPGRRDHAVLWLITEGCLQLQTPSGPMDCGPGTLVFFPPGTSPQAANQTALPASRYALSFAMRVWGELDFFRLYQVPALHPVTDQATLVEPWAHLVAQLQGREGTVTLAAEGWARILVDRWLKNVQHSGELQPAPATDDRLTAALAAIEADLAGDWSPARLAEVMHLSPVRVRQLFTSSVGVPPTRYVTLRRLSHARALLAHTTLTSVEIAGRCGYSDPRYFSRVFTRETGMRPTRYRQQAQWQRD